MTEYSYRLKIEWANLETYFTRKVGKINTEWFNKQSFKDFLKYNEYVFSLKDVEYLPFNEIRIESYESDINLFIKNYHNEYKHQMRSFLAIDKYSNKKIILRTNDLVLFPKFFENWIINEIYYDCSPHHILEYYQLKKELEFLTHKNKYFKFLSLTQMIYFTLSIDEINKDNYNSVIIKSLLSKFERIFECNQTVFDFKEVLDSKANWIRFCKSLRLSFTNSNLNYINYNNIIPLVKIISNNTPLETILSINHDLSILLNDIQLFNDFLKIDNMELLILQTLPWDIDNKQLSLTLS